MWRAASADDPEAQRVLSEFRDQKRVGVLCTVDMAGEGYDCPDIAVLGYASNKLTSLYVRQVTARAMRITDRERELRWVIPSAVVIPDSRELVEKLIAYLAPAITEVRFPEQAPVPGSGNGGHPDEGVGPYTSRLCYILTDARADGSQIITVPLLDGTHEDVSEEIRQRFYKALVADQVPGIFASRVAAKAARTVRDLIEERPFDDTVAALATLDRLIAPDRAPEQPARSSSLEGQAKMLMARLSNYGRWWAVNGDTPPSHFNNEINDQAGIPTRKRDSASVEQLQRADKYAWERLVDYCNRTGKKLPRR